MSDRLVFGHGFARFGNLRNNFPLKNSRVCRKLQFGDPHPGAFTSMENILRDVENSDTQRAKDKYEFDILKGEPVPDAKRWQYSAGSAEDGTPDFYLRGPHKRPSRSRFRPLHAAATSPESAFHTPLRVTTSATESRPESDNDDSISPSISRELFPTSPSTVPKVTEDHVNADSAVTEASKTVQVRDSPDVAEDSKEEENSSTAADSISTLQGSNADYPESSESKPGSSADSNTRKRELQQSLVTASSVKQVTGKGQVKDHYRQKKKRLNENKE